MHYSQLPFTEILVFVGIDIKTAGTMPEAIDKAALVDCFILEYFDSLSFLDIVFEESLVITQIRV